MIAVSGLEVEDDVLDILRRPRSSCGDRSWVSSDRQLVGRSRWFFRHGCGTTSRDRALHSASEELETLREVLSAHQSII